MRRILLLALALTVSALAADVPASEESIRELLKLTESKKLVDGVFPQVESMMKAEMQRALKGQTPSPEAQTAIDTLRTRAVAMMREELAWEKLEPIYLRIYQRSFSQEEIEGIIAFYRTPAGIAMVKKLPVVMQETMVSMQQMMGPMMQRVQTMVKETIAELQTQPARRD